MENIEYLDTTVVEFLDYFPKAIVEIGSHTDNSGSPDYNLKLSQKRAEHVVKYLARKGLNEDRLSARGYGMETPIALNNEEDGTENAEGQRMNRRTEIKIIGYVNQFEQFE
jgi:outer membrane protein OmpA-like peptidoglycan-associated protein